MNKSDLLAMPLGEVLKNKAALAAFAALTVVDTLPTTETTKLRSGVVKRTVKGKDAVKPNDAPKVETKPSEVRSTVIEAAPKERTNVTQPMMLEITPAQQKDKDGKAHDVLIFKSSGFNYRFKGWHYANTKKIGQPMFKWDPDVKGFIVEPERLELLMKGIHETYQGSRLIMGEKVINIPG